MFLRKYFKSLEEDIQATEAALADRMPDKARATLEKELKALKAMWHALNAFSPATSEQKKVLKRLRRDIDVTLSREDANVLLRRALEGK